MSKVFDFLSLELSTKNRFEGSCPRGISYRQTGIYRIGFPIFILRHHSGANPSSAQYSSILNIKPSFNCMKLTTWKNALLSTGNIRQAKIIISSILSILSISQSQSPGYSQFALIYSSTVNNSLVQCHFIRAFSWKYFLKFAAFCDNIAFKNSSTINQKTSPQILI